MQCCTLIAAMVLIVFAAGCSSSPSETATSVQTGMLHPQVTLGEKTYGYALYIPDKYDGKGAWPVIIFLNGSGECGTDGVRQTQVGLGPAVAAAPHQWPFVIIYPQKPDQQSAWIDHDRMVMAMLEETRRQLNIDPKRIYLTGLSQGGGGTWAIAAAHPRLFAAIAPVCGYGDPATLAPKLRDVPIWAFHGEKDDVVPPAKTRAIIAAIEAAGGSPKATYFPEANHNSWDAAYRTQHLGQWLLDHSTR